MEHRGVCKYGKNCEYLKKGGCKFQHLELNSNSNSKSSSTRTSDGLCKYGNSCPYISTPRGCKFKHPPKEIPKEVVLPNFPYHPEEEVETLRNFLQTIKGNWDTSFTETDEYYSSSRRLNLYIDIGGPPKSDFSSNPKNDKCINGIMSVLFQLERRNIANLPSKNDIETAIEECSKHAVRSYYNFSEDDDWKDGPSFETCSIQYGLRPDLWVRFYSYYTASSRPLKGGGFSGISRSAYLEYL